MNHRISPNHLLVGKEELEVLKLAASVRNLVRVTVKSLAVLVLRAGLVVSKHADTVLHSENLVVHTAVVTVLVPQVVEALSKLSNELILLGRSNLDTRCLKQNGSWVREVSYTWAPISLTLVDIVV